ncbi:MAG: hypothetical protein HN368_10715 [Spirochaetales bacterium]|jgi:predicted transcriptional regulator|nr:hypothetical protein [Spirochaetales bacterium]
MRQSEARTAAIEALQKGIGEALNAHINKLGTVTAFAEKSGILRQTLYRLLGGETVGTDILLRTLRAMDRHAEIENLLKLPNETPLEKVDKPVPFRTTGPTPFLAKLKTAKPEKS